MLAFIVPHQVAPRQGWSCGSWGNDCVEAVMHPLIPISTYPSLGLAASNGPPGSV